MFSGSFATCSAIGFDPIFTKGCVFLFMFSRDLQFGDNLDIFKERSFALIKCDNSTLSESCNANPSFQDVSLHERLPHQEQMLLSKFCLNYVSL